jgi:hypothetical protein
VGLDVRKDSISAGVLPPGQETPEVERFFHDQVSLRRFVDRLGDRACLRVCYEARIPERRLYCTRSKIEGSRQT